MVSLAFAFFSKMSDNNNKDQTTARDYVKSYINNSNSAEFLEKEQPRFDPSKPVPSSQPEPVEEIKPKPVQDNSSHFNIHLPTQNPISNNENEKKQEPTAQQQQHWTTRGAKEQRSEIHETALTVCADLNEDLMNCFNNGSWWDKAKMCEDQKQKFWNCYNSQKVRTQTIPENFDIDSFNLVEILEGGEL